MIFVVQVIARKSGLHRAEPPHAADGRDHVRRHGPRERATPRPRRRGQPEGGKEGMWNLNCTSCQVTGPGRRAWACELESARWSGRTGTQTSILKPMGRQKEDVSLLAAAADSDSDPGPGQTMMKLLRGPGRAVLGLGLPGRNMTRTTGSEHGTT